MLPITTPDQLPLLLSIPVMFPELSSVSTIDVRKLCGLPVVEIVVPHDCDINVRLALVVVHVPVNEFTVVGPASKAPASLPPASVAVPPSALPTVPCRWKVPTSGLLPQAYSSGGVSAVVSVRVSPLMAHDHEYRST